jgi:hypothetical protein
LSVAVLAAAELSYNPVGHAQEASPPQPPEAQVQDSNVAPPPAQPFMPPPQADGPIVTLRATSPKARLQLLGQQLRWQDVCAAPCNVPVNPAGTYRVGGGSIRASEGFQMPRSSGPVLIEARTGSKIKRWVGIGMMIAGIGAIGAGTAYYLLADDLSDATGSSVTSKEYYQVSGIVYGVIGVILLAIGIPLSTSHTSVTVR